MIRHLKRTGLSLGWASLGAILAVLACANVARADYGGDDVWIIGAGASAGVNLQTGSPETSTYSLQLSIGHSLGSALEFLVLGDYTSVVNPGLPANSAGDVEGQLNLVLMGGHMDAFYLGARAGEHLINYYGANSSNFEFGGVLGKRFMLAAFISYEPTVAVMFSDVNSSISSPAIDFVPLQFTFLF